MSAFIGSVRGPSSNSPNDVLDVWASIGGVEIRPAAEWEKLKGFDIDPIAARNFAALLVRASEEVERMRNRPQVPA